jgi:hypothetical protein
MWLSRRDRGDWGDRKLDHVRPYLETAEREGRYGVVVIVQGQELQWVLVADNIAIGRPEEISLVFARRAPSKTDRFASAKARPAPARGRDPIIVTTAPRWCATVIARARQS